MNYPILPLPILILGSLFFVACRVATTVPPPTATPLWDAIVDGQFTGAEGAVVNSVKTYKTVTQALEAAPENSSQPHRIFIKNGRYYEKVAVAKPFIAFIGQVREQTILTYDAAADTKKSDGTTYGTSDSASITVRAPDFRAENLTIENGSDFPANAAKANNDPTKIANTQAVALKTDAGCDRAIFKNIRLSGYQDTLYADAGRQYFSQCTIRGSVDFIFGAGQAVFDDCNIVSRDRGSATNNGYITAASTDLSNPYGFLLINSRLKKENPGMADQSVTLGRPWHPTKDLPDGTRAADPRAVASVAFVNCWMDSHIAAQGWESMTGRDKDGKTITFYPADTRFFEFGSAGQGAIKIDTRRVLSEADAQKFSIRNVLGGWNPQ